MGSTGIRYQFKRLVISLSVLTCYSTSLAMIATPLTLEASLSSGNRNFNGHFRGDEPECYGPYNIQLTSDIDKYETHCRIDNRIMAERLWTLRRQDDLNDRLYRLERLVNMEPHTVDMVSWTANTKQRPSSMKE